MNDETLALDLDLFDDSKNGYIPVEIPKKKPGLKLIKTNSNTSKSTEINPKQRVRIAAAAFAIAVFGFVVISSLLYMRIMHTEAKIDLDKINSEYAAVVSEGEALELELDEMISTDKVEKYAVDHGMVKCEGYQIKLFDLSGSDGAVPVK